MLQMLQTVEPPRTEWGWQVLLEGAPRFCENLDNRGQRDSAKAWKFCGRRGHKLPYYNNIAEKSNHTYFITENWQKHFGKSAQLLQIWRLVVFNSWKDGAESSTTLHLQGADICGSNPSSISGRFYWDFRVVLEKIGRRIYLEPREREREIERWWILQRIQCQEVCLLTKYFEEEQSPSDNHAQFPSNDGSNSKPFSVVPNRQTLHSSTSSFLYYQQ